MPMTSWVRASRMRLATVALPDSGEKRKTATPGCGLAVASTWIALTWSFSVIGLSTEMVKGTVLPFSAISGRSITSLPSMGLASPSTFLTACSQACAASCAQDCRQPGNGHARGGTQGELASIEFAGSHRRPHRSPRCYIAICPASIRVHHSAGRRAALGTPGAASHCQQPLTS